MKARIWGHLYVKNMPMPTDLGIFLLADRVGWAVTKEDDFTIFRMLTAMTTYDAVKEKIHQEKLEEIRNN